MALETSILTSTKKLLNIAEADESFDPDIMTHINAALSTLNDIGIGPSDGFFIEDATPNWEDLALPANQLSYVKNYIQLHVRLLFDPPSLSFVIESLKDQRDEYLIRLSYIRENLLQDSDETEEESDNSASGTQSSPSSIWIMAHDLGFNPAGFRFTTLDELTELEPESITYVSVNVALAIWPDPIAGKWVVS